MNTKVQIRRLDELARQYPSNDKEQAISNLANHTLNIILGKEGKFEREDKGDVVRIAEAVIKIGDRVFPQGDPDEDLEDGLEKTSLSKGKSGRTKGGRGTAKERFGI